MKTDEIMAPQDGASELVISGDTSELRCERARIIAYMRLILPDLKDPDFIKMFQDDLDRKDLWAIANRLFSGLAKSIARGSHQDIPAEEFEIIPAPKGSA